MKKRKHTAHLEWPCDYPLPLLLFWLFCFFLWSWRDYQTFYVPCWVRGPVMRQDNLLIPRIMILMMILFCLGLLKHRNAKCSQICCVCVRACVFSRKSIGFQPAGFRSVLYQWSLPKLDTIPVKQLFLKKKNCFFLITALHLHLKWYIYFK